MRILCVFLSIFTTLFFTPTAAENSSYYLVISDNALFYCTENFEEESALFIIPKGYYVLIKSENTYGYAIEYSKTLGKYVKLSGYVKKEDVKKADAISPLSLDLSISAIKSTTLFNEETLKTSIVSILSGQSVAFYGYSPNKTSAFCCFNNEFGYINLSNFESFQEPTHPVNSISSPSPAASSSPSAIPATADGTLPKSLQILLIVFICIPVVVITILLFSFSSREKKKTFYE